MVTLSYPANTTFKPVASLYALLNHLIDYAGLFPPASLYLNEAYKNYLDYQQSSYNWMLSRFICPARLLHELGKLIEKSGSSRHIPISVIVSEAESDLNQIKEFINNKVAQAEIETLETRFTQNLDDYLKLKIQNLFIEFPSNHDADEAIKTIKSFSNTEVGFKLRAGGTESSAFPASQKIAEVIKSCKDSEVKMKFTAGLHHPVRHFSKEVNTKMHGFLNVFCAGIMAYSKNLTEEQLNGILNDESVDNFQFSEGSISWKEYTASVDEILEARKNFVISFGSCSFEVPVNDLKSLGII